MIPNEIFFCLILFSVRIFADTEYVFGGYHHESLLEGDKCYDEAKGQYGLCTPIAYCPAVSGNLEYYIQNGTTCWYGKGTVILCCLQPVDFWVPPAKRTISQKMCVEYSKNYSLQIVDTPPLLTFPPTTTTTTTTRAPPTRSQPEVYYVYGGKAVKPHEYPHMAALGWPTIRRDLDFKCGGTLVSPLFVLTAGHCTATSSRDSEVTSTEPTVVRLGAHELSASSPGHPKHVDAAVRRIVRHPAYRPPAVYNDIALVELVAPVELNNYVRPACLWQKNDFGNRKSAIVTGWGSTSKDGTRSNVLLKAFLTLFSNGHCQPLLQHLQNRKWRHGLSPEQMCAGDSKRKHDSCRGDSGGPLQVVNPTNPLVYYVVGITSFGDSCPAGSGAAVYTRVSSFIPWIQSVVWPTPRRGTR